MEVIESVQEAPVNPEPQQITQRDNECQFLYEKTEPGPSTVTNNAVNLPTFDVSR